MRARSAGSRKIYAGYSLLFCKLCGGATLNSAGDNALTKFIQAPLKDGLNLSKHHPVAPLLLCPVHGPVGGGYYGVGVYLTVP